MPFNRFMFKRNALSVAVVCAVFGSTTPAYAEQVLEEVTVTAQKREQTLQEIPVAVSAFSAEFILKFFLKRRENRVGFFFLTEVIFAVADLHMGFVA